jgi:hypothetical protein
MPNARTVSAGVVLWAALGASLRADSLTVSSADGSWTYFVSSGNSSVLSNLIGPTDPTMNVPVNAPASSGVVASTPQPLLLSSGGTLSGPSTAASASTVANGFINFGSSNYADASGLTSGTPQPWYTSPVVQSLYGGQAPSAAQQSQFTTAVLNDVNKTFQLAGMNPTITTDPTVPAAHMISVVSGASYAPNDNAIGITNVGVNGFGFIDKLGFAQSVDQLEWAVAHNVSHEMMHAFGVAVHVDQTGNYIDAAVATPSLLTSPDSTFSPGAVTLITQTAYGQSPSLGSAGTQLIDGDQEVLQAVPEPSAVLAWSLVLGVAAVRQGRVRLRRAA